MQQDRDEQGLNGYPRMRTIQVEDLGELFNEARLLVSRAFSCPEIEDPGNGKGASDCDPDEDREIPEIGILLQERKIEKGGGAGDRHEHEEAYRSIDENGQGGGSPPFAGFPGDIIRLDDIAPGRAKQDLVEKDPHQDKRVDLAEAVNDSLDPQQ